MDIELTPTSYLVLGCLARGPATPYEMKQIVSVSIGYFWSFPHSQLYSEPARLARAGLLSEQREETGRRRRRFAITAAGERALRDWVGDPTAAPVEVRDTALLKLFFADVVTPERIAVLARHQQAAHRERLDRYRDLAKVVDDPSARATLELGLAYERATTAFWRGIAENPPATG